jgi:4'-phosphopantetheinyl transferase
MDTTGRTQDLFVRADLARFEGILPNDEVHVWHADFKTVRYRMNSLRQLLDPEERDRASRFKLAAPREQFVISRAFLRLALGGYLRIAAPDVRFQIIAHGKPELAGGGNIRFNLSHTDGVAVLAIARHRAVGVDVERVRDNVEALEIADRFFSSVESDWLRSQPASERIPSFFACWTAKEAYIKACGKGLSSPLRGFSVIPRTSNDKLQLEICGHPECSTAWAIWRLDLGPDLRCAVAVQAENSRVRLGKWPWPPEAEFLSE